MVDSARVLDIITSPLAGAWSFQSGSIAVANTKTAKKQLLISRRNRARNVHFKSMLKNALKRARALIAKADDAPAAQEALSHAVRALYRCASKGVIKRRNALRRVSRIMRMYDRSFRPKPAETVTPA